MRQRFDAARRVAVQVDDARREAAREREDGLGVLLALAEPLVLDARRVDLVSPILQCPNRV